MSQGTARAALAALAVAAAGGAAVAQETTFGYQGRLNDGADPAQGAYDLTFSLWDADVGGGQVGSTVVLNGHPVDGGLVLAELDFGIDAFNGERWLEVTVDGTALTPRQRVLPSPKAMQLRGVHVAANGYLGVNHETPNARLHVEQSDDLAFYAQSQSGGGVFAVTAGAGQAAVWGNANSGSGYGVRGQVDASPGAGRGVWGRSFADQGVGVWGEATNSAGAGIGVYGRTVASQQHSAGVYGIAEDEAGTVHGGWFTTRGGGAASGVVAQATSQSGPTFGVQASVFSPQGRAISGFVAAPSGGTAVRGSNNNPDGWAGQFLGRGHFRDHTSIGRPGVRITTAEQFGVHTVAESGQFGGMYVSGQNQGSRPFYGYSAGGVANDVDAYHYYDGQLAQWKLVVGGLQRLIVNGSNGFVGIADLTPDHPLDMVSGAHVTVGGVWTNASSRELKHDFQPVDARAILARVAELPILEWSYVNEGGVRHLGPVAEDFAAAFALGSDDRSIGTVDADGVALAAIQGLCELVQEKDRQLDLLSAELRAHGDRLAHLESLIGAMASGEGEQ